MVNFFDGLKQANRVRLPRSGFWRPCPLHLAPVSRRKALVTLPIYLDYLADPQGFDNAKYGAWLANRGMRLPGPEDYLPGVLDYI